MLALIIGAGILGIIIVVMEGGNFPGWPTVIVCALAALVPALIVNALLPPNLFFIGLLVGALCAALAIAAMFGMSIQRAFIAAGIYLGFQLAISFVFQLMMTP